MRNGKESMLRQAPILCLDINFSEILLGAVIPKKSYYNCIQIVYS